MAADITLDADPNARYPGKLTRLLARTGLYNDRNLYWHWGAVEKRNFGDWVGPYLFQKMTGKQPIHCGPWTGGRARTVTAAGSIMTIVQRDDNTIVWGSGIMARGESFHRPLEIRAVRGPHTRARCLELGYDCPETYGDPAILLPDFIKPSAKKYRLGIIPHIRDTADMRKLFADMPDTLVIDVDQPLEVVLAEITSCESTVSTSLHGIIVSHSYDIPSAWIRFSDRLSGDGVKFADYMEAGGVPASAVTSTHVDSAMDRATFLSLAKDAPMPDNEPLRAPLRAACPFKG